MEHKPIKREIRSEKLCAKPSTLPQQKTMHAVESFSATAQRMPAALDIFTIAQMEEPERWDGMS